jgi:hypothetical protein
VPAASARTASKEAQLDLFADRLSTATFRANQLRLASAAYVLMHALRRIGLEGTALAPAERGRAVCVIGLRAHNPHVQTAQPVHLRLPLSPIDNRQGREKSGLGRARHLQPFSATNKIALITLWISCETLPR